MKYKNTKTGVVIDVASPVVSPDWKEIQEPKAKASGEKKTKAKASGENGQEGKDDEKGNTDPQEK